MMFKSFHLAVKFFFFAAFSKKKKKKIARNYPSDYFSPN